MKKNVLALSIATMIGGLGFTNAALAAPGDLSVNANGDGHILVVPYYTVQDGNVTAFNIVNTDLKNGKAVKVRFRGASNSDDVLDFQVFLSPGDVWAAAVSADANGLAQLVTSDNSCTRPAIAANKPVPFVTDRLEKSDWTEADKNAQTREGYIEILNMADIDPKKIYDREEGYVTSAGVNNAQSALYKATKHAEGTGVAPCTPSVLASLDGLDVLQNNAAVAPDDRTVAATIGLVAPTGGLTGNWFIMNAERSTTFSASATAIKAELVTPTASGGALLRNVYSQQKGTPAALKTADPLMTSGLLEALAYDVPDLSTPIVAVYTDATTYTVGTAEAHATAVSTAIGQSIIANQFLADDSLNASTDWVISMPTRRYVVAANYAIDDSRYTPKTAGYGVSVDSTVAPALKAGAGAFAGAVLPTEKDKAYRVFNLDVKAHATDGLFEGAPGNSSVNDAGQICATADSQVFLDRSEQKLTDGAVFSPGKVTKLNVCGEVSVVTFGAKSPSGAALSAVTADTKYTEGWGYVSFATGTGAGKKAAYVPVLGAAFTAASNPSAAAGMIGNYGITWPHFYSVMD